MALSPDHPSIARPFDTDDIDEPQRIRDLLIRRINATTHPSRLINQIGLADWRSQESTQQLARLIGRSPKVLAVIRAELRKEFEIDPDSLLFTEPKPPDAPRKVDSLTDRALSLLVLPKVVINLNQFTALSVRGDPNRRLPYTPLDVLQRVITMGLFERLDHAAADYWNTLVVGSWLTRRERWGELQKALFADRAFIALQLEELSSAGMALVQALIDAPTAQARTRAGGERARVKVSQLMWSGNPPVAIPGALHLYQEGGPTDALHVIYLSGAVRHFYEGPSFFALQCALMALNSSLFQKLWRCLPLSRRRAFHLPADMSPASGFIGGMEVMDDALEQSAQALLAGQWSNEQGCAVKVYFAHVVSDLRPAPQPLNATLALAEVEHARQRLVGGARLGAIGNQLLKWDQQRRDEEVIFASAAPGRALYTVEQQVKRYEKGLVALLNPDDVSADTPAYLEVMSLLRQLSVHTFVLNTMMQNERTRLLELAFWKERPDGEGTARRVSLFLQAQAQALRCEAQLQYRLKLMSATHRDLVVDAVDKPWRSERLGSQTQLLSIRVGSEPDAFYALHNVWVVTTAAAVKAPSEQHPVVLYGFGGAGGVVTFSELQALTHSVKASLSSPDDSVLWRTVERDKRRDLRTHAAQGTLAVRYGVIKGYAALTSLMSVLRSYDRLRKNTEDIRRIFSEVTDPELSRSLLMVELEEQLKIPVNDALNRALANVELLRMAACEAKNLPAWLARATRAQRTGFMHLHRHYLSNAFAFRGRLDQHLPDLETFARRVLMARLSKDGISAQWGIDQPFIEMPDDVYGSFCVNSPLCPVGDRDIKLTPTITRTTFSLLQLTMQNLDPLAPWTKWRFNLARYLQPGWKERLSADYLIELVSSLDIGGQYDTLINTVFYPQSIPAGSLSEGRIPELLNRALHTGFAYHLFLAIQRGLSAPAQSVFSTAMAARVPQDLLKNQHTLQLYGVHLVAHTMQHDRYISGIVLVHDKSSGLCVVYWPEGPQAMVLTEYPSLQQAQDELNRIGALPDNVKVLVRQIAPGWAFEAITHHPDRVVAVGETLNPLELPVFVMFKGVEQGTEFVRSFSVKHLEPTPLPDLLEKLMLEQIASDPQGWLAVVPTAHSDAQALLYRASVFELQRRTQAASHSGKALQSYRTRRMGEQSDATQRRLTGFFSPFYGTLNEGYELSLVARRFHRYGDVHDAVDMIFMAAFLVIDLLANYAPGPRKPSSSFARAARPTPSAVLGRIRRLRMTDSSGSSRFAPTSVTQLNALDRFKVEGVPEGAILLKGVGEHGVYVRNGEFFITDDTHHFPLYRRGNEQKLRLKNPRSPGQDELILNINQPREWLLEADAPQPGAGPSSSVLNPWRPPVPPPPDWRPPSARTATQDAILQSTLTSNHWLAWRVPLQSVEVTSPAPGVFRIGADSRGYSNVVLRVAPPFTELMDPQSGYYRLLPAGDHAPLNGIVFIHRNEPMTASARFDIERWTGPQLLEQPLPVSRSPAGEWLIHAPLFDRPLPEYVGRAFPTMTRNSRELALARVIELSDSESYATASHMLNLRATLDNWLPLAPARPGQTDDLLRLLRPTTRQSKSIFIGLEGKAPGFTRADFQVTGLDPALRGRRPALRLQRNLAMREAITRELQQQGFDVQEVRVKHFNKTTLDLIATHPLSNSNNVYYLSTHWVYRGTISLDMRLTNRWLSDTVRRNPGVPALAGVESAMGANRLMLIVAGIQWSNEGVSPPTVYFAKVSRSGP